MGTQGLTPQQALTQAVNRVGSQSALARICGVSQAAVWKWIDTGAVLPAEHVFTVETATGVLRHELRPDLYPRGLQDDVPFSPPPDLSGAGGDGADERQPKLSPSADPQEWPIERKADAA
jgi:DNA-binding transcriptional regulator YdaS (Cro superfamily)